MEAIVISILAFLIPGLVCYWYNKWREGKEMKNKWRNR